MPDLQHVKELRVIEESQRVEKLLLEACDSDTRTCYVYPISVFILVAILLNRF